MLLKEYLLCTACWPGDHIICFAMDRGLLELDGDHHLQFIKDLDGRIRKYDYWQADYLRLNGVYWALTALLIIKPDLSPSSDAFDDLSPMKRDAIIDFVIQCQSPSGKWLKTVSNPAFRRLWWKHWPRRPSNLYPECLSDTLVAGCPQRRTHHHGPPSELDQRETEG